jgi:hypothetical protein
MLDAVSARVPVGKLAVHFHDTYGQALANIFAALEKGIAVVDSSVAGLGGCPYAPGASGNVASEDVLYLLDGMSIRTGRRPAEACPRGPFYCRRAAPHTKLKGQYCAFAASSYFNLNCLLANGTLSMAESFSNRQTFASKTTRHNPALIRFLQRRSA